MSFSQTPHSLAGNVAIVTGGSRGIGLEIAKALRALDCSVMVSGRSDEHLREAGAQLGKAGAHGSVGTMRADVREFSQVEALVQATVERFGGLHILINNAGVGLFGEVADQAVEEWRTVIDTNLTGVFYCCKLAIPHLRRAGGGWIINISSLAGKNPFAGAAAYCASKAALNAFSEALMQEVRHDDIRVSHILPGSVRTGFGGHSDDSDASDWKLTGADVAQVVVDLLGHERRSLPSRVELRPSKPRK